MKQRFTIDLYETTTDSTHTLVEMLNEFNQNHSGSYQNVPLNITVKNETGEIIGGLIGRTYWGWFYIDTLVVRESMRGCGIGMQILQAAENEAVRRGCRAVHLETHSFQAPEFYLKKGYTTVGVIDNLPANEKKFIMTKDLSRSITEL